MNDECNKENNDIGVSSNKSNGKFNEYSNSRTPNKNNNTYYSNGKGLEQKSDFKNQNKGNSSLEKSE